MRANTLDAKALEIDGQGASGGVNDNLLINGNFDIWQRGTSSSINGFVADRFKNTSYSSATAQTIAVSRLSLTPGDVGECKYAHRIVVSGTPSGNSYVITFYAIEDCRTAQNQNITLSFWAKTSASQDIAVRLVQVTDGGSPATVATNYQVASTTTAWVKYTMTFALSDLSTATSIGSSSYVRLDFSYSQSGTYNTSGIGSQTGTFDIAQIKLERGSVATPFIPRPIAKELSLCQRYYSKSYAVDTAPGTVTEVGMYAMFISRATNAFMYNVRYPVTMRATPTVKAYSHFTGTINKIRNYTDSTDIDASSVYGGGPDGFGYIATSSGIQTDGDHIRLQWTAEAELL